jgi:hypothetical protein
VQCCGPCAPSRVTRALLGTTVESIGPLSQPPRTAGEARGDAGLAGDAGDSLPDRGRETGDPREIPLVACRHAVASRDRGGGDEEIMGPDLDTLRRQARPPGSCCWFFTSASTARGPPRPLSPSGRCVLSPCRPPDREVRDGPRAARAGGAAPLPGAGRSPSGPTRRVKAIAPPEGRESSASRPPRASSAIASPRLRCRSGPAGRVERDATGCRPRKRARTKGRQQGRAVRD